MFSCDNFQTNAWNLIKLDIQLYLDGLITRLHFGHGPMISVVLTLIQFSEMGCNKDVHAITLKLVHRIQSNWIFRLAWTGTLPD